ncbi:enoyl-CoA hydratase/isomerase family protein [Rhodococcus sp. H36-A4]|uniref:enoyl-CoA hydratase/isomerase family protein n=1 Tax=Rhodococcus sp. H36-A4 TaxID=3004353 RepID=UPI0022AE5E74|nr:enoyl-CoA hydratase/isomerase family protein [Rhodococcus sp. H36-A4]MCZ4080501.1 enoyl-CoA hydratase/isomerase family protein [Rhodococcus sp. H36-A4]
MTTLNSESDTTFPSDRIRSDGNGGTAIRDGSLAIIEFDGEGHNTFSTDKMLGIAELVWQLGDAPEVEAIVLYGGDGRSFGVGGDFNEVKDFTGGSEVNRWIDACVDMYRAVLSVSKPTVAVVDRFCIGIGLQLALCADWRVGTTTSDLRMPELKLGISCILGAPLLQHRVGPAVANRMIIGCDRWLGSNALADGLIDELASNSDSLTVGRTRARTLSEYQSVPFAHTKAFVNHSILLDMERARIAAIAGHRAGFASGNSAQQKMRRIVGENH